jgi:glycosyltransferase involved in cell wall biosynthesis
MRIGIDCRALQEPFPSGVSVYTRELLTALWALPEAQQHTFVLFFSGWSIDIASLKQEWRDAPVEWRVKRFPNKLLTAAHSVSRFPSARWMFGDVDMVFVPNLQFYPWRDNSVPYVVTVHDLSFERYRDCLSAKGRARHRLVQPRKMIENAACVITVSDHTASDVKTHYGIDAQRIYPGLIQSTAYQESPTKKTLLSIATVEPRKNMDALLDAFAAVRQTHPDVDLVIAGGPGWKSRNTIEHMQQMDGVDYRGYVTDEQKQELLASATAFVYPSVYEGFGFPPLEAQQAGVPVLVGNHSSLPEVLGDSALYVDVMDVHALERGMLELLTDGALRDRLCAEGAQNVLRFSWKTSAQQVLKLFTSV